jgi:hypothetical protein
MAAALPPLCSIAHLLYCHGFLAAFGGTGIADNYSGCSEYANGLPVIVDGNDARESGSKERA